MVAAVLVGLSFVWGATEARAAGPLSPIQTWTEQFPTDHPQYQLSGSMVYNPKTGTTLLFGGSNVSAANNQTWEWDGTDWTRLDPATDPFPRTGAAMAFDQKSGNILMFGGTNTGAYYNDTYSWDGTNWTLLNPATKPSARYDAGMAYDSATGEIVMFGGARDTASSSGVYLNDTWTWSGTNWVQETPASSPPAGTAPRMEFDPGLGKVLLYGVRNETTFYAQTWTWNGSNWSEVLTANAPPGNFGTMMGYNPTIGRMVTFGGSSGSSYYNQTWTFDGTNWTQLSTPASPPARFSGAMSFDPSSGRMLMFGGYGPGATTRSDTWYFGPPAGVGSNWTQEEPAQSPPPRSDGAMAFDPGSSEIVMYGGYGGSPTDTWTWDGETWTRETPATSPPELHSPSMAFDPQSGDVILFGGTNSISAPTNQTWAWDGTNWTLRSPGTRPSPRSGASMTFDQGSGDLLLFGGTGAAGTINNQTWAWDGANWNLRSPANPPPARAYATMAFDESTGRSVLFGGTNLNDSYYNDTWNWNGTNWSQASPADQPAAVYGAASAFYPNSGYNLLAGGNTVSGTDSPIFAWQDGNWFQQYSPEQPGVRFAPMMAFDPVRGQMVLYGGATDGPSDQTWTYELQVDPPSATITNPIIDQQIPIGSSYATAFSCEEAPGAPGLASCVDEDGVIAPNAGQLDTSSAGYQSYSVTATSQNGLVGTGSVTYEVMEADPEISVSSVPDAIVGDSVVVAGTLSGGYNPGGDIVFRAYGPDDETCSGTPAFESSPVTVTGNDQYASTPGFVPAAAGVYRWVAEYSGDSNNDDAENACGSPGSVMTVGKASPTIVANSATDAEVGETIKVKATLAGGFAMSGRVIFRAFSPGDDDCSGTPAYDSGGFPVSGPGEFEAPGFIPNAPGTYRWLAIFSGNNGNHGTRSVCGAEGTISTVTAVPPPPDVCPAGKPGLRMVGFGLKPPYGKAKQVPGIRVALITSRAVVRIQPTVAYRLNGRKVVAKLKTRTLGISQRRNLRFHVPKNMARAFRQAGRPLKGQKVTFAVNARIKPRGSKNECFRRLGTKKLNTRVVGVSGRVALRKLSD